MGESMALSGSGGLEEDRETRRTRENSESRENWENKLKGTRENTEDA